MDSFRFQQGGNYGMIDVDMASVLCMSLALAISVFCLFINDDFSQHQISEFIGSRSNF